MSGTVHLVSGRDLPGRPTLCAALRRCASRRAERIVSVGAGVPGSVATIPMPADRIGLAAPVFEAWARRHMKSDDAIVAWDTPAMCVAAETGYRVVAVLDGVHRAGAVARCATVLVRSGDVQLCGASVTTSRRLGSAESGTCGPLLPPEMSPLHEKDGLRVSIAAEPAGMGTMLPLIGIFGRLHLLGMALSIHIAGAPADAAHGTAMLAAIGITNVTVGSMAGVPRQSGEVVFLPVALGVSGDRGRGGSSDHDVVEGGRCAVARGPCGVFDACGPGRRHGDASRPHGRGRSVDRGESGPQCAGAARGRGGMAIGCGSGVGRLHRRGCYSNFRVRASAASRYNHMSTSAGSRLPRSLGASAGPKRAGSTMARSGSTIGDSPS